MGCADFLGCPKNVLDAEPRRMSSRDVRYVCSLTPVLQRGCTCCRCSRARKPRYSACKPRSGRRSSSRSAYVPFLFFFVITLRAGHRPRRCTQLADSQGYDYHPPLPDTEAGPLGDCAICMDAIERPPEDTSGKPRQRGARVRASYSLAPCAHLFVSPLVSVLWRRGRGFIDFIFIF